MSGDTLETVILSFPFIVSSSNVYKLHVVVVATLHHNVTLRQRAVASELTGSFVTMIAGTPVWLLVYVCRKSVPSDCLPHLVAGHPLVCQCGKYDN